MNNKVKSWFFKKNNTVVKILMEKRLTVIRSEMSITRETSKNFKVIKWIYDNLVAINRNSNKMEKFHEKKSLSNLRRYRQLNILKHQKSEAVDKNTRPI